MLNNSQLYNIAFLKGVTAECNLKQLKQPLRISVTSMYAGSVLAVGMCGCQSLEGFVRYFESVTTHFSRGQPIREEEGMMKVKSNRVKGNYIILDEENLSCFPSKHSSNQGALHSLFILVFSNIQKRIIL